MNKPVLLDLCCGAGGASEGYRRAGFTVIGVDNVPQPNYPFEFHQLDWRDALRLFGSVADGIHASFPCKAFTKLQKQWKREWSDEVTPGLAALQLLGKPFVVENVPGAPYVPDTVLCGSMFGLMVRRHRWFKHNLDVIQPDCEHNTQGMVVQVNGHPGGSSTRDGARHTLDDWRNAMGINWMNSREIAQAIPPVYTEYIGRAMIWHIDGGR